MPPDLHRSKWIDTVSRMLGTGDPRWAAVYVAQPQTPDLVLAAGLFQPNVHGRFELSSLSGLRERQVMKSRAMLVWSRVVLAITPLDLFAIEVALGAAVCPIRERWSLSKIRTRPVRPASGRTDTDWPALRIERSNGIVLTELRPMRRDESTRDLLARLVGRTRSLPEGQ